jgi:PIN domain nuclease of toxin-antitoxin system
MRLLLDTHAFLWIVQGNTVALSETVQRIVAAQETAFVVSIATVWEMAIKSSIGKLPLSIPFGAFVETYIIATSVELLGISAQHTVIAASLPFYHRDPFDRLLNQSANAFLL